MTLLITVASAANRPTVTRIHPANYDDAMVTAKRYRGKLAAIVRNGRLLYLRKS